MAERYADALRSLRSIWIDAGTKDEFTWTWVRGVPGRVDRLGVPDDRVHFELFEAGHGAIDTATHRVTWLAHRLER